MKLLEFSFGIIIGLIFISGCSSEKASPKQLKVESKIEVQFDIPNLLKMNIHQVKDNLGVPKSEFIPNEMQVSLDSSILSTIDYEKETTIIQIDYSRNGRIKTIFISDESQGRTKEDILKLGKLEIHSSEYKIRVQEWLNPEYARKLDAADIAGIEVIPY